MPNLPQSNTDVPLFLRELFDLAVASAAPENCLPDHLPTPPEGRTLLVAAGKAAASMAKATEVNWPNDAPISGYALTRYGHGSDCRTIEVIEAAHPVPDNRGYEAAIKLLAEVETLTAKDMLLFLVSGGGSSLLALPAEPLTLDDKKTVNHSLLMSGAPIGEMNAVRKHLSAIKGGRLAAAASPAKIVTLAVSDVPHDDPSTIASGPTVPDETTSKDAINILEKYEIDAPETVIEFLNSQESETHKSTDPIFDGAEFQMISTPTDMLESVVQQCEELSANVVSLGADLEGEAREIATTHADLAWQFTSTTETHLILSGGEATVTVEKGTEPGRGGRNCEFLLALAIELDGAENVWALAADTDGIDGSEDNAGAVITPETLTRAQKLGIDAKDYLERHDSYSFFEKLGDLIKTGPTLTNVNDFRAVFIASPDKP